MHVDFSYPWLILRVDLLLEVVQVDPALRLFVKFGAQPLLLVRQLLQPDVIAAAGFLRAAAGGELLLQLRQDRVDRLELPLLVIRELQLLLPRPLRLRFFGLFGLFRLLFLRRAALARPVGPSCR